MKFDIVWAWKAKEQEFCDLYENIFLVALIFEGWMDFPVEPGKEFQGRNRGTKNVPIRTANELFLRGSDPYNKDLGLESADR